MLIMTQGKKISSNHFNWEDSLLFLIFPLYFLIYFLLALLFYFLSLYFTSLSLYICINQFLISLSVPHFSLCLLSSPSNPLSTLLSSPFLFSVSPSTFLSQFIYPLFTLSSPILCSLPVLSYTFLRVCALFFLSTSQNYFLNLFSKWREKIRNW